MDRLASYKNNGILYENNDIVVFKAHGPVDYGNVIIKAIKSKRPSQALLTAFRHEYQINHEIKFSGLVHCEKLIEEADSHFLIYEDTGGISLKKYLSGKPLTPDLFLTIAKNIINCLSQLHAHNIIHKDIKPDNLLIHPNTLGIQLLDLSLASQLTVENQEVVSVQKLEGSLPYMSPEQTGRMNRPIDYRSDYYSLGITFYEMLTGSLPFTSNDPLEYVHFHLAIEPKSASKAYNLVPQMLSKIVAKLMAKSADDRYQSAEGLLYDLELCHQGWLNNHKIEDFNLGSRELLNKLTISSEMYGRENEVKQLMSAFDRVKDGNLECVMIGGYSGIGKTTLVNELQKPITQENGYYISGKFDQLLRTTPYTAFTTAFSKLIQNWLTESEERLEERKNRLLLALGSSGQVMIDFFPEIELVLGKQPEIEKLSPEQAQNRFLFFFQKFISCIANRDEPLVIFIDDLQWIDQGSLRLLDIILSTQDAEAILFIGAFRNNEVDESHPLIKLLEKLKKSGMDIENIELGALGLKDTERLLTDTFKADAKLIQPLAKVLYKKTDGNPFFTREFLKECFHQNYIKFSLQNKAWEWDLEKIQLMAGSNNVIDLMLEKINKLPSESQKTLQLGSCLGMSFDCETLCNIEKIEEIDLINKLSPAIKEGLIQRIDGGLRHKFIHDRIQQATYQTISDNEKTYLHLKAGRLLLSKIDEISSSEDVFEVLDHFNRCKGLIDNEEEKIKLAELALRAGRQAIGSNAYQAAKDYLSLGLLWLLHMDWDKNHKLHFHLNLEYVECLYLQGDYQDARTQGQKLLEKKLRGLQGAYVYRSLMKINNALGNYQETVSMEVKGTKIIGIDISLNPSMLEFYYEFMKYFLRYKSGSTFVNKILSFKRITNEPADIERTAVLADILFLGASASIFRGNITFPNCATMRVAVYFEKNGVDDNILYQLIDSRARIQYQVTGSLKSYETIWQGGMSVLKTRHFPASIKALFTSRSTRTAAYFSKIKDMIQDIEPSIQTMVETGSFTYLPWSINANLEFCNFSDLPLADLKNKANEYVRIGNRLRMQNIIDAAQHVYICAQHMLDEKTLSLDDVSKSLPATQNDFGLFSVFNYYFEEEFKLAKHAAQQAMQSRTYNNPSIGNQIYYALSIMILAQLYPSASDEEKTESIKEINKYLSLLKKFSDHNPDNFLHLYLLGQAELARIQKKTLEAFDLYNNAIQVSQKNAYTRWTAIANERLGEMNLEMGYHGAAIYYISEAIYFFEQWGCNLKVKRLQEKYGHTLLQKQKLSNTPRTPVGFSTTMMTGELDLMSLIKANQAISSEIILDKLLPKILKVVTESAGAEKAIFIGLRRDVWTVETIAEMNKDTFDVRQIIEPLQKSTSVPEGLITYTIRSGSPEVISDISADEKYAKLEYVQKNKPKSALCIPILRDKKVTAILYLENNLTTQAFTPDRVQILSTLSTQIAISLENARYLEHTQQLFHATERFVPKKFLQLLGRKNIEEVQIGDSAKSEMSAIFADLRDFTSISEAIEPEQLTYILNTYLKYMAPIIRQNNGFINRVLGDGILALFPGPSQDAVQAAVEMLQAIPLFNQEINDAGFASILMGVGVNTGPAMLCALGEEERIEANVVSDMVNGASRIEGLNKMYGTQLLISDATYDKLMDASRFSIRKIDKIRVKGKTKAMTIYEVLPSTSYEEKQTNDAYIDSFEKALTLYTKGDIAKAKKIFEACIAIRKEDPVANIFVTRCQKLISEGIPENWDAIINMMEK
ncbi:MAG: AAA family ATPase [Alphaproteobacteria bacterium]|nr:AAA family ATPase [Alphaproteobacteria bacterium]